MGENLRWGLTEFGNLSFKRATFKRVSDRIDIYGAFIGEWIEKIVREDGFLTLLFVAKNKIDPMVKMFGDKGRFESFSAKTCEMRSVSSPRWKNDISKRDAILFGAEIEIVGVGQKIAVWNVKLGDKLFYVSRGRENVVPSIEDGMKHAIRRVKFTVLKAKHIFGSSADKIKQDIARSRVMSPVEEFGLVVGNLGISLF